MMPRSAALRATDDHNYSGIGDVSALATLTSLRLLHLRGNAISDLTPLTGLTNLGDVALQDNAYDCSLQAASLTTLTGIIENNGGTIAHDCG